jgi:low temperature requirement protein LtrA
VRPDQLQGEGTGPKEVRVSTIELFFDLVFVFAITQLTSLLAGDPAESAWEHRPRAAAGRTSSSYPLRR